MKAAALAALLLFAVAGQAAPQRCAPSSTPIAGLPWSVEATGDAVWVLTRRPSAVTRVGGARLPLGFDPWDLAVGSGSLWVAPNGDDGRLRRVDLAATRVSARVGGGEQILSSFVTAGAGRVWAATDERVAGGRGVFEIDPARDAVVGDRIPTASDVQDLAVGFGSVWVADHSASRVTRIDPVTRRVVASIRVGGAPHGLAVGAGSVWVALWHERRLREIDPETNRVEGKAIDLGFAPVPMAAGATSVWVAEAAFDHEGPTSTLVRIDAATRRILERVTIRGPVFDVEL